MNPSFWRCSVIIMWAMSISLVKAIGEQDEPQKLTQGIAEARTRCDVARLEELAEALNAQSCLQDLHSLAAGSSQGLTQMITACLEIIAHLKRNFVYQSDPEAACVFRSVRKIAEVLEDRDVASILGEKHQDLEDAILDLADHWGT